MTDLQTMIAQASVAGVVRGDELIFLYERANARQTEQLFALAGARSWTSLRAMGRKGELRSDFIAGLSEVFRDEMDRN